MNDSMFSLAGRTALVTGSSRGIGRAIAEAFAKAGAKVLVHGSKESAALREAAAACGGVAVAGDLGSSAGVEALIAAVPPLDILVLNASVQDYVTLEEYNEAEFLREFQTNVGSAFRLVQAFAPGMCERHWGRVVAVGSVNQFRPSPRLTVYSATKAALQSLVLNAAKSYAPFGVTVNNLVPGVILTDRNAEALKDDAYRAKILGLIPAGNFGRPEDCAGAALLLASDAGRYITGIELPVTGGMHL